MPTTPTCPECGTPLPADAPQGLCPKCLLRHGMDITIASDEPQPTLIASPTIRYFGDYELGHEIARGGMGAVFKARQVKLNRPVAVKMILEGLLSNEAMVKRFYTEAEAAANLQHPNIVAIHEIGAHDGQHYFSMDFVEGKNLAQLTGGKPLAPARAARYVEIMASAIHYAHQRGTLHRDLKPSNVLIDEHDQPRITDFGLAKLTQNGSHLTVDGAVMGTPSYMSPEQAAGRQDQIGPHSDVYSLGAILYELLTGQPPFKAASPMATMREVIESDPVPPRKLNPEVPLDIETICLKCLEKSPQRRYPSARELSEELGRFLKGDPVLARPASFIRKTASWLHRHPGSLAALTALVILGLAVFSMYLMERNGFLEAQRANPGLIRQPGPSTEAVRGWLGQASTIVVWGFLVQDWFSRRSRGVKGFWKWNPNDPALKYPPTRPVGLKCRTVAICLGVLNIVCAISLIGTAIEAYVWEARRAGLVDYVLGFLTGWQGLWLLYMVVQDYRLSILGPPSRELTADQNEAIRRAVLEYDIPSATQTYRKATEAGLIEASEHVSRLVAELGVQPPAFSLRTLNWRGMAIHAGIAALVVYVLWLLFPPSRPHLSATYFGGALFAVLWVGVLLWVGAWLRIKGKWTPVFVLVFVLLPAAAVVLPLLPIMFIEPWRDAGASETSIADRGMPFFVGMGCGLYLLMSSAFNSKRCGKNEATR